MRFNNLPQPVSEDNARLAAALTYAARGWPVFPLHGIHDGACTCSKPKCGSRGKHPRTQHGKDEATTDAATIRAWWQRWPDANVGGLMGEASGVIALDVDPPKGEDSLAAILNGSGLPATPISRTGRGRHVLFAHPGRSIGNRAGLRPGLDVRGDGGYIVLPPSSHEGGNTYAWELSPWDVPLAPMAGWLLELFEKPKRVPKANGAPARPAVRHAWAETAMRNECEAVARAREGTRNATLNRAAFSLGQLIPGGYLDRSRVEVGLFGAAGACGLVTEAGEAAVRATLRSGIEAGEKEPRGPKDHGNPGARRSPIVAGGTAAPEQLEKNNPTDLGNAERLAAQHGGELRYCAPWRGWLAWDGRRWAKDRNGEAWRRAKLTVRDMLREAANIEDDAKRGELVKHQRSSESQRRIAGMLELAKSDLRIAAVPESFDGESTRYLLNVLNGTLDVRTGELRPHRPEDGITKLAPVDYDPGARSDLWELFLERVLPNADARAFVQRYVGSALTDDAGDQALVLCYGPGANGKSTLLETVQAMLGEYGHKAAFDTLLEASGRSDRRGAPRADLLALHGARFVTAVEAGEGRRLDEQLVKELTGGDQITARGVYHDEQTTFRPASKIVLAVNHRPEVRGSDDAIWRRVLEVPFTVTIPKAERDPKLPDRLREPEHQRAVLAWAVAGCRYWLHPPAGIDRLRPPEAVVAASRAYRLDQDELLPFIEDCCQLDPNARVSNKELRAAYLAWVSANGVRPLGPKQLPLRLQDHGCRPFKSAGVRGWKGIALSGQATQGAFEGGR